jgi:lysyl-tRNA synthetase class 2
MTTGWQPTCSLQQMQARAVMLQKIRAFFVARNVLEVETPLLGQATGTDPNLDFFSTQYQAGPQSQTYYLQTSPEFCMKRLLAAGSGSIYQISKAFRNNESGRYHNPEFSLLEWYRVGFNLQQLIDEVADFLTCVLAPLKFEVEKDSYINVFSRHTGLDPLDFSFEAYSKCAKDNNLGDAVAICAEKHPMWLDFLFSFLVQPQLGKQSVSMVFDYPACQSSLARVKVDDERLVERVEVFINGIELGNGYFELSDPIEQRQRFDNERKIRKNKALPEPNIDRHFLNAIASGLPDCSGIAIGLDRLLMIMTDSKTINQVITFPIANA